MRILITIPHYFHAATAAGADVPAHGSLSNDPQPRIQALTACLSSLHHTLRQPQCTIDIASRRTRPANAALTADLDLVICTTKDRHLLKRLPPLPHAYQHRETDAEPLLLGFECHAVLQASLGQYDYYCYLEDDLILRDPWLFAKLAWFNRHLGNERLLQPNRYEAGAHPLVSKAYIDGDQRPRTTARYQTPGKSRRLISSVLGVRVFFRRALNPHSGCFFLNAAQMQHWANQPHFLDRDTGYVGPLESAATLGILRTFEVCKPLPQNASFLEIEHFGTGFMRKIRAESPPR
jgi:hypothetical protein